MRNLEELEKYRLREDERRLYGINGDSGNGIFKVIACKRSFVCIASSGGGWEHVSASPTSAKAKQCATWEEMCEIKNLFFLPEEVAVQYHPKKSEYVNIKENCLHLWRYTAGEMPTPPKGYV